MKNLKTILLGGLVALGLVGGYAYSAVNISDDVTVTDSTGLVLHQTFNGSDMNWSLANAEARDISGQNNHGDVVGAVATAGQVGQGLEFDGVDDYVSCGYSGFNSYAGTISAWVKIDSTAGNTRVFSSKHTSGNNSEFRTHSNSESNLHLYMGDGSDSNLVVSIGSWTIGERMHILYTWEESGGSTTLKGYKNGVYKFQDIEVGVISVPDQVIELGRWGSAYFDGSIDEFRIYSRALSAQEIADQYRQGARKFNIDLQKGLVGHWELSEESYNPATKRLTDNSAYSNHGTGNGTQLGGSPSFEADRMGQAGRATPFNGTDDYIDCGNDESLDITDEITISVWVKPDVISTTMGIVDNINYTEKKGYGIATRGSTNKYMFWVGTGDGLVYLDSDVSIDTNWHHILGVRRSGTNYIYVDGVEQSNTNTQTILTSTANTSIGLYRGTEEELHFTGSIADVRVYSRALSAEEIERLYNSYKPKFIMN